MWGPALSTSVNCIPNNKAYRSRLRVLSGGLLWGDDSLDVSSTLLGAGTTHGAFACVLFQPHSSGSLILWPCGGASHAGCSSWSASKQWHICVIRLVEWVAESRHGWLRLFLGGVLSSQITSNVGLSLIQWITVSEGDLAVPPLSPVKNSTAPANWSKR